MVEQRCARLATRGQLVEASGTTRWPDKTMGGTFKFLHALHRDTVYNRLAPAERARLHGAVAERLERGWSWERTSVAAVLAGHFECATDCLKAAQYHLTAVDASKVRLANHEVVVHCGAAMSLLPRLPPSSERDRIEMASSLELATALALTRGYAAPEVRPLTHRARDLARALELPQVEVLALSGLYMFEVIGGERKRVLELAGELMQMAEQFKLPLFVLMAHGAVGIAHYNLGNLAAARSHIEQARAAWTPNFPNLRIDSRLMLLGTGALVLQQLGDTAEAEAWIGALIACLPEFTDPLNAICAYRAVATYRHWAGDREGTCAWAERAVVQAEEHGLPEYAAMAMMEKGYALGDLAMQRHGFAVLHAAGYRVETPTYRLGMAETLIDQGRWDEAREEIALALAITEATGEVRHLSEIHRVGAQCLRAAGQLDESAAALRAAIDVARRQQSRPLEQRARADLEALSQRRS
jgi:adenylate cyclase